MPSSGDLDVFYYLYFSGRGRAALANVLNTKDPFAGKPADVVERILAVGHGPAADKPNIKRWPTTGSVYTVERADKVFILAISKSSECISLQEVRADAYDPVE